MGAISRVAQEVWWYYPKLLIFELNRRKRFRRGNPAEPAISEF